MLAERLLWTSFEALGEVSCLGWWWKILLRSDIAICITASLILYPYSFGDLFSPIPLNLGKIIFEIFITVWSNAPQPIMCSPVLWSKTKFFYRSFAWARDAVYSGPDVSAYLGLFTWLGADLQIMHYVYESIHKSSFEFVCACSGGVV